MAPHDIPERFIPVLPGVDKLPIMLLSPLLINPPSGYFLQFPSNSAKEQMIIIM